MHIELPGLQGQAEAALQHLQKSAVTVLCCVFCSSHNVVLAVNVEACRIRGGGIRERHCLAAYHNNMHLVDAPDGGHIQAESRAAIAAPKNTKKN